MSGYDYGNARLRAMKSQLLARSELQDLAEIRNLDGLIAALAKTVYGRAVDIAIVHASGLGVITEALRLDLIDQLGRVRGFYGKQAQAMMTVMLRSYDVHNLKTVLRGLSKNAPVDEIQMALIPIGELSDSILAGLIRTAGPRAAIDTLASMRVSLARPLLALRAQHPGATTLEMELALDRWYFEDAHQQDLVDSLRYALNLEADFMNLMTALRFAHAPMERQSLRRWLETDDLRSLFVKSGKLSSDLLMQVARQNSLDDAIELLAATSYGEALGAGLAAYRQSKRLSDVEKPLGHWRLRQVAALMNKDPLGIGVPLSYFALKTSEVSNICWIAQGINLRLEPRVILHELEFAI